MPKGACPANKYFKTVYLDDVPASECMFCGIRHLVEAHLWDQADGALLTGAVRRALRENHHRIVYSFGREKEAHKRGPTRTTTTNAD